MRPRPPFVRLADQLLLSSALVRTPTPPPSPLLTPHSSSLPTPPPHTPLLPLTPHSSSLPTPPHSAARAAQAHLYEEEEDEADGIAWHLQQLLRVAPDAALDAAPTAAHGGEPLLELAAALGRLQPSDVAVLARTKAQLQLIEKALKRRGVPCRLRSDGGGGGGGEQSEGGAGGRGGGAAVRPMMRDVSAQLWLLYEQVRAAILPG